MLLRDRLSWLADPTQPSFSFSVLMALKADTRKHIVIGERFPEWIIENEDLWDAVILPAFALAAFASSASSVKGYFAR